MEQNRGTGEKITQGLFVTFLGLNIVLGGWELYSRYQDKKRKKGCGCGGKKQQ